MENNNKHDEEITMKMENNMMNISEKLYDGEGRLFIANKMNRIHTNITKNEDHEYDIFLDEVIDYDEDHEDNDVYLSDYYPDMDDINYADMEDDPDKYIGDDDYIE